MTCLHGAVTAEDLAHLGDGLYEGRHRIFKLKIGARPVACLLP